jgi:hypothetical protein
VTVHDEGTFDEVEVSLVAGNECLHGGPTVIIECCMEVEIDEICVVERSELAICVDVVFPLNPGR